MNSELIAVLDYLENERGIDRETLLELVEESLLAAARKAVGPANDLSVRIDRKTGDIHAWARLTVVETITHPDSEITLAEAQASQPETQLGDIVEWEVTPEDFGRIAAQTAKQTIMQRLRQAERSRVCDEYQDQLDQLISGVVSRVERGELIIDFARGAEGSMRYSERIPGEEYRPGDHITALLIEINLDRPGPALNVSRSHPNFVRRLFEREVTEIAEGLVEIKAVAREAGYRSKLAVHSREERVDPVGSCVGLRGNRVKTVVRELGGEKVDIIRWSDDIRTFVANALQPAKLSSVEVDQANRSVSVTAPDDQLSLAIGRKGQNARLAAKLTGWHIDISKKEEAPKEEAFEDKVRHAVERLASVPGIGNEFASALVSHGFLSLEGIIAAETSDLADIEGIGAENAEKVIEAARTALGA